MADITITCPQCSMTMQVRSEWRGMNMRCPGCQSNIVIPALPETPVTPPGTRKTGASRKSSFDKFAAILWKSSCLLLILIGLAVLIRGAFIAVRVSCAQSEKEEIKQEYEKLSQYRSSRDYSRKEYEKKRERLDKKSDKWEENYEDIQPLSRYSPKSMLTTGIAIFIAAILAAAIDFVVFSLGSGNLGKTRCPISQIGIVRLLQLLYGTLALLLFLAGFNFAILFIFAAWFAAVAVSLHFHRRLGVDIDPAASLAEDATGILMLPWKAVISLNFVPFIAGEIVLAVNFFRHDFHTFTGAAILMGIIAFLPLLQYLFFLFAAYFLEIGLSIVTIPKLLKKQLEK
ncbi:MAG: hypothetical protein IKC82_02205 [Lentisphaeria bacterium]|nr:hypothetical protein [Lentisphaeria bacterium]